MNFPDGGSWTTNDGKPSGPIYSSREIKKSFGLLSQQEIDQKIHYGDLNKTRDDLPFKIIFYIIPEKTKETNGFTSCRWRSAHA